MWAALALVAVGLLAIWRISKEWRLQREWEHTPLAAKKKSWVKEKANEEGPTLEP